MTISEIKASDKIFLTPAEIAEVLGTNPQAIRIQARVMPEALGFPVSVIGTRVKIPRKPFLAYMGECSDGN